MGGMLLSQGLQEKGEILLSGELLLEKPRDTQNKALEMGISLHRDPVEGCISWGLLQDT
jgi:hypothetical protein